MTPFVVKLPSDSTFFTQTPEYRMIVHSEVFDLVYHGKGGFNWTDVYNLPVFLRRFYIKKVIKALEDKADAIEKERNKKR